VFESKVEIPRQFVMKRYPTICHIRKAVNMLSRSILTYITVIQCLVSPVLCRPLAHAKARSSQVPTHHIPPHWLHGPTAIQQGDRQYLQNCIGVGADQGGRNGAAADRKGVANEMKLSHRISGQVSRP
jgi:hypothetical protein